jgi:hypothetical protein
MSICNKFLAVTVLAGCAAFAAPAAGDDAIDLASSTRIDLPADSPVTLISTNMDQSRASSRGGAIVLDLHMSLTLKNSASRRVRGVVLLVTSQEFAPGGKGSIARPCIDVPPNQNFTVPIDLRLVRPVMQTGGPLVRVQLDGVLFDDLSFYGPNKLNSQRAMTFWEVEAQRDRAYFKQALQAKGEAGLQKEIQATLARDAARPELNVALTRGGRATPSPIATLAANDHLTQFAFLTIPGSPVQPLEGWAAVSGNEARSPRVEVLNQSNKSIRYVEIGWMVKDKDGQEYVAGSIPASESIDLPAGRSTRLAQETSLKFTHAGKPVEIQSMTAFVSQVEFADGRVWVPSRQDLSASPLLRIMAPSTEEQRLADLYSKKGLAALVAELNRY